MIRLHNLGEVEELLSVGGAQAVANDVAVAIAPFAGIISAIFARLSTAGVTGSQNTDIKLNGATIFANSAAAIQFATGSKAPTYGALAAANPPVVAKGDQIRLDTTAIHTTPARGLAVYIVFRRTRSAYGLQQVETDTVSSQSDTL